MITIFLLVFLPIVLTTASVFFLDNFFEAAGYKKEYAKKPFQNLFTFYKIIHRKPGWMFLFFFPYVNLILMIWMFTEFLKVFDRRDIPSQVLGIFFGLFYLPYLNYPQEQKKIGILQMKNLKPQKLEHTNRVLIFIVANVWCYEQ